MMADGRGNGPDETRRVRQEAPAPKVNWMLLIAGLSTGALAGMIMIWRDDLPAIGEARQSVAALSTTESVPEPMPEALPEIVRPRALAQVAPNVHYSGCNEVRALGRAPLYSDQPGYSITMDGDGDGIACEPHR